MRQETEFFGSAALMALACAAAVALLRSLPGVIVGSLACAVLFIVLLDRFQEVARG